MTKHLSFAIFLLTLIIVQDVKSQNNKLADLEKQLKYHTDDDTARVNLLNRAALEAYPANIEKCQTYATIASELSDKIKYKEGFAESQMMIGVGYEKSNINKAIVYITKAIVMAEANGTKLAEAKYLITLGNIFLTQGDDKAFDCFQRSIKLAEEINNPFILNVGLHRLAIFYDKEGNYDKAIIYYQKALNLAEKTDKKNIESECLNSLGKVYGLQGKYPQALDYFLKYQSLTEGRNDKKINYTSLNNIGCIYLSLLDFPKALVFFKKALLSATELDNKKQIATTYANIGCTYMRMRDSRSLEYFQKTLILSQEINNYEITITTFLYMGELYLQQGKLTQAMEVLQKGIKLSEEKDIVKCMSELYYKVGEVYLTQKKYDLALNYTLKALDLANKSNQMNSKNDIHKQLSKIYAATNDFASAYFHQKRFFEVNDSVHNDKNTKRIAELEYKYKFEKEKHAIELKQQKKDTIQSAIMNSLLVVLLLLSLFAVYVYRSLQAKHRTNLILSEQNDKIENLNAEYRALNKEYLVLNEQLKISNAQINKELELNQKSLTAATLKIIQNAERDALTIQHLLQIEKHTDGDGKKDINALIAYYKRSSYNSNWEEFEILFEKVHGSFYKKIHTSFPTLTSNERKMCAFLKLNMSNKDIANITFQSEEALKKARLRLRQKLQIDRDINLSTFLQAV